MLNLQKASFGKRIIAAIFDGIFLSIIAVGFLVMFANVFNTDQYINTTNQAMDKYKTEYNITLNADEYAALSDQDRIDYDNRIRQAEEAFANDKDAVYAYNMWINLTLSGASVSILLSVLIIEFVVPLLFGNGQTLGKKIFGIALMHKDHIRVNKLQLFVRAILGKFAIEIMIPLYIIVMILSNSMGISGTMILLILLVIQLICMVASHNNSLLHDVMSGVVAVDMTSQKIFDTREDLTEYIKKTHAQKANDATY